MNETFSVKILEIEFLNHNVKRFRVEKPSKYSFSNGQATEVAVNSQGYSDKFRPFTFTSLDTDSFLEFIIKMYPVEDNPKHTGVTEKIGELKVGNEFLIKRPFGDITYKGSGLFLAGGTGITPFYSIFKDLNKRNLSKGNRLVFSNSFEKDIFLEDELKKLLENENICFTLTQDKKKDYEYGRIDEEMIRDFNMSSDSYYYVCGPTQFQQSMISILEKLNVSKENIVAEGW